MGTRHLTTIYDTAFNERNLVVNIYGVWDGYPAGHGAELAKFLGARQMCNGLPGISTTQDENGKTYADGAGCLAAQLVATLKTEPGVIYLVSGDENTDHNQEYTYIVSADHESIHVEVRDGSEPIYTGDVSGFVEFCKHNPY